MTAVNILLNGNEAYVLTDGLASAPGVASFGMSKVYLLPHLSTVVTARGFFQAAAILGGHFNICRRSFDDIKAHLSDDLAQVKAIASQSLPPDAAALPWACSVVGWSDAEQRFAARICSSHAHAMEGLVDAGEMEAFVSYPIEGLISPSLGAYAPPDGFQAARDGLDILRRQAEAHPEEVGGFAQLTTLRRSQILTTILERWAG